MSPERRTKAAAILDGWPRWIGLALGAFVAYAPPFAAGFIAGWWLTK